MCCTGRKPRRKRLTKVERIQLEMILNGLDQFGERISEALTDRAIHDKALSSVAEAIRDVLDGWRRR
jgi:hypothetical protein